MKYLNFVNECESLVFFVVLPNFQKLIKQFLLFYYSCIYISVKKRNFGKSVNSKKRKSLIRCVFCVVSKLQLSCVPKKIPSEYWNNKILLTSLKTQFCLWFFQGTKSSLTNFYCFNIHAFISLWKRGIPEHNIAR